VDGRVKPGHDMEGGRVSKEKKKPKETKASEAKTPETTKPRPIGLDAGKIVIHDSFFDPLPDGFSGMD